MLTIANVEMAKAWDGEEGDDWADYADRYEASGARFWQRLLDALALAPGHRVLDIGCGTGRPTTDVARLVAPGAVIGVDLSSRMLGVARDCSAAEHVSNVTFLQADAQVHPFEPAAFDLAMSSFGAMFFADAPAAFTNIAGAIRSGGQLALLSWQPLAENPWLILIRGALAAGRDLPAPPPGGPGPFGLSEPDAVTTLLTGAGFADVSLQPIAEPVYLGADAEDAWSFVRTMGIVRGLTGGLDEATKAAAMADLRRVVDDHAGPDGVLVAAAAWLITARRV